MVKCKARTQEGKGCPWDARLRGYCIIHYTQLCTKKKRRVKQYVHS